MLMFLVRLWLLLAAASFALLLRAELAEIKIAQQYGISYLPLMLMEEQKLVEKHAKAAGIDVKVGAIKVKPDSWKNLFFPNVHGLAGS